MALIQFSLILERLSQPAVHSKSMHKHQKHNRLKGESHLCFSSLQTEGLPSAKRSDMQIFYFVQHLDLSQHVFRNILVFPGAQLSLNSMTS